MQNLNNFNIKNDENKNKNIRNILIISAILILTTFFVIILFNNAKKNKASTEGIEEIQEEVEKGSTALQAKKRYDLILQKLAKRELLIIEEEKFNNMKINSDARLKVLKEEGIKKDILEMLIEFKKEKLLLGDDIYIEESNMLKIGKINENTFSYEIKIKSIEEILSEESKRTEKEVMIPLKEYTDKIKEDIPNNENTETEKNKEPENTTEDNVLEDEEKKED